MELFESSTQFIKNMKEISYPVCWGDVRVDSGSVSSNLTFSEDEVSKQLQLEYWWKSTNQECASENDSLLGFLNSNEKRSHLSEYQLVREVIWCSLGSRRSNIFTVAVNENALFSRTVSSKAVGLNHLSYPAADSLLNIFARWCSHNSILRKFADRVAVSVDCTKSPCLYSFMLGISDLLRSLDHFLHNLEKDSRGPCCFTLLSLHDRLLPWSRRIGIIAGVVMQTISGKSLADDSCAVQLIDNLFYLVDSFRYCILDKFFIRFLDYLFIKTFQPFLLSVIELLSGSCSFTDPLIDHFADVDRTIKPDDPLFWFHGVKLKTSNTSHSSSLPNVPRMFLPVLLELVNGIKAIFLIMSIAERSTYSLKSEIFVNPVDVFESIQKSNSLSVYIDEENNGHDSSEICDIREDSSQSPDLEYGSHNTHTFPDIESSVKSFISERSKLINQELLKILLLESQSQNQSNLRSLGICLATVGAVYLFGAGDRMNDFARGLFQNATHLSSSAAESVGLTLSLRSQFDVSAVVSKANIVHSLSLPEIQYFQFTKRPNKQTLVMDSTFQSAVIASLKSFKLDYTTEWPLTIILDAAAIEMYDDAFSFLLQIKYIKWILEYLRFDTLGDHVRQDSFISHKLFLLRIKMLFIFNSLHDFLAHRIEGMRVQFVNRWHLPDVVNQVSTNDKPIPNGTLTDLINDHQDLLKNLRSTCLHNESSALLRQEVDNLCDMVLTLQSFWLGRYHISVGQPHETELKSFSNQFDNHISFLATMLSRAVHLSSSKQLLPLSDAFSIAAASCR